MAYLAEEFLLKILYKLAGHISQKHNTSLRVVTYLQVNLVSAKGKIQLSAQV